MNKFLTILFALTFAFLQLGFGQTKLENDLEKESDFRQSNQFKNQVRFALEFFDEIIKYDKESFITNGEYDENWIQNNIDIINNYDSIRYHMTRCIPTDTSITCTFQDFNNETIRATYLRLNMKSPEKGKLSYDYRCEFTFYNKLLGELLGVDTDFIKRDYDPEYEKMLNIWKTE
ncbi:MULTISPECIES: hypothetical protein [unclassified Carboxylicivirga]|uniref:hypothetical protein n=1 Tax=Carboxylicivirga TaxID=1628153 RepID=UPI003D326E7D